MSIQRKINYSCVFTFQEQSGQRSIEVFADQVTNPEWMVDQSIVKTRQGPVVCSGRGSCGTMSITLPMIYAESSNPTATLVAKLYERHKTLYPKFDVEIKYIEEVAGVETPNYVASAVNCEFKSIKADDVGTDSEELSKIVITFQPRTVKYNGGVEV